MVVNDTQLISIRQDVKLVKHHFLYYCRPIYPSMYTPKRLTQHLFDQRICFKHILIITQCIDGVVTFSFFFALHPMKDRTKVTSYIQHVIPMKTTGPV